MRFVKLLGQKELEEYLLKIWRCLYYVTQKVILTLENFISESSAPVVKSR